MSNDAVTSMGLECVFKAAAASGEEKSVTRGIEKTQDGKIKCISPAALGSYLGWNFNRLILQMKDGTPLADHPIIPNDSQAKCIDLGASANSFCWRAEEKPFIRVFGLAVENFLALGLI